MPNSFRQMLMDNRDETTTDSAALSPSRSVAVATIAVGCVAFALYAVSLSVGKAPWSWWMQIPIQSAGMLALVAGFAMLFRRPGLSRIGALLVAFGVTWYIGDLQFSEHRAVYAVGFCLFFFNAAVMAQIALSFPLGRLRDPITTVVVISLYGVILVTQITRYFVEESPPPQVWGDPKAGTYSPWATAGTVAGMVLCAAVLVLLIRRWRSESPPMRRSAIPVRFFATLATVIVSGFLMVALTHAAVRLNHILLFGYATVVLLVPLASQVDALREWVGRANAFERLADFEEVASEGYRELLAKWLGDPKIEIHPWLPDEERCANLAGETVEIPTDSGRTVTFLEWKGRQIGALFHDSSLTGARQLKSVAAVTRIVLEKEALQARLRSSRNMLIELEIKHRKELQSALHDGGQDEVIGIRFVLRDLISELGRHAGPGAIELLQEGIARSDRLQDQIKEVAFELYPPALDYGLKAGVMSLFDKLRLPPKDLTIPETRWPKRVEHVAYRVISEAIRNARTHARAKTIRVKVTHQPDWLIVEVLDDGVGGAELRGVGSQRALHLVNVLEGKFTINSPHGVGTHVKAELPCTL
ncbi:sensor histidine kinase [Streptomyces sioyaensis]|uniref:sensor histidine kinase n=1 Tax=Streptomyces sioyaensis TaxID=67364 RepID=UPI00378E290B